MPFYFNLIVPFVPAFDRRRGEKKGRGAVLVVNAFVPLFRLILLLIAFVSPFGMPIQS
jgi:hypothetical protein